jgi:uncharacterized protein (TIGR02271 family)
MANDVIVASYQTPAQAENASRELEASGIPATAIHRFDQQHPGWESDAGELGTTERHTGFWSSLFGTDDGMEADHRAFDETVGRGGTVVSVTAPVEQHGRVMEILERFNPIDLDAEGARLAGAGDYVGGSSVAAAGRTVEAPSLRGAGYGSVADTGTAATRDGEQVIALAEEQLQVGKRMVETGRTRIRRYVVETPVEERVRLRTERVTIERRRPVSGDTLSPDAFTETVTEITERGEEAVVAKTAHVGEEVVVRTEAGEREETVRDTVRREEVEITGGRDQVVGAEPVPAKPAVRP